MERTADPYRLLFEFNPLPTWVFDVETLRFLEVNAAAIRHYGYRREEFLAMTIEDIRPPEDVDRLRDHIGDLPPRTDLAVWRHRKRDGTIISVELSGHALELHGRPARLIVAHDISERLAGEAKLRASEEQLRQSQKMEAIGLLAGGIAHDFNNMLTVILTYSDFVLAEMAADDPSRPDLEQIRRAGDRACELTRQLLVFSRRHVMERSVIDLNVILRDTERMLRRVIGEHIDLCTIPGANLAHVHADGVHLEQALMNLVVNARDAMPDGGTVTIETSNVIVDGAPHVMLAVRDIGCGMSAETRSRIFEPFFTTKEAGKGTGLGLSTVYGIVQDSDGVVEVESEPGRGTTFKILLPAVGGDEPARPRRRSASPPLPEGSVVLVVEDDAVVRMATQRALTRAGCTVLEASQGDEAFVVAAAHAGRIDLLLCDMTLPGMPGTEVVATLRAQRPLLKVLLMSGYTDRDQAASAVGADAIAYIQKPFDADAIVRKVRELLGAIVG